MPQERAWVGVRLGLAIFLTFLAASQATAAIPTSERDALLALYSSTNGTGWTNADGWNGAAGTECGWYGVTCDSGETTVVEILLAANNLTGTLPAELGNLTNLEGLSFLTNQITGSIPAEIGGLAGLLVLDIGANQLSGSIPAALGDLSSLEELYLDSNQLTGSIPAELGGLTNLLTLELSQNQLSGSIPAELGNLSSLIELWIPSNQLSGSIPTELGNLTGLLSLYLRSNQLTGVIPTSLTSLTAITSLALGYNALHAEDPGLVAFLDALSPGWQSTQTVAPTAVAVDSVSPTSVTLSWTPISYIGATGGYRVSVSTTSGGPYSLATTTADKSATGAVAESELIVPGGTYYLVVDTLTEPHEQNQNTVISEQTAEVPAVTPAVYALSVTKDGTGTGAVTSSPAGIDCGATCSADFVDGTVVTLSADADGNSTFVGWSGEACSGTGTCVVTMDVARSVTAIFDRWFPTISIDDQSVTEGD